MLNVLTVDVEDYFSVETFRHIIRYEDWDRYAIRVDIGLRRILDLLERHNVTATFFVLGWMADRRPDVRAARADRWSPGRRPRGAVRDPPPGAPMR